MTDAKKSASGTELHDGAAVWRFAHDVGCAISLKQLHDRSAFASSRAIIVDWLVIFASFALFWAYGPWLSPLALLLIGNRQRALMVLVHDGSHYALHSSKHLNDLIAQYFLCAPMLTSITTYRRLHLQHHNHLGDEALDTDFLHSEQLLRQGAARIYASQLLAPSNFRTALVGALPALTIADRLRVAGWWLFLLVAVSAAAGPAAALAFALTWLAARLSVYHAIISFVIISDHFGLVPGTILGFTRNHPPRGAIAWLLHPHHNGLHLTHHVLPGLPFHALNRAHGILLGWRPYAAAEHCGSYFIGADSVLRSWQRLTPRQPISNEAELST